MKRKLSGVLSLIGLLAILAGCATGFEPQENRFTLFDMTLRHPPSQGMVCIEGACLEGSTSLRKKTRSPMATFTKVRDVTHWGQVQIGTPKYYYHQEQLVQIQFKVECHPSYAKANMTQIMQQLRQWHPFIHSQVLEPEWDSTSPVEGMAFWTDEGVVAIVSHQMLGGIWGKPSVKVYYRPLMEQVRQAMNPNYAKIKAKRRASWR